jgi:hypothetical protein
MCLTVNENKTNELRESNKKVFTFYKMFDVDNHSHRLQSPWWEYYICSPREYIVKGPVKGFARDIFINESNLVDGIEIGEGVFHGFLNKEQVAKYSVLPTYRYLVKIKVKKEDFVAVGYKNEVCFKAFTITKFQWMKFWFFHKVKRIFEI